MVFLETYFNLLEVLCCFSLAFIGVVLVGAGESRLPSEDFPFISLYFPPFLEKTK
jgi:hypothetical protein